MTKDRTPEEEKDNKLFDETGELNKRDQKEIEKELCKCFEILNDPNHPQYKKIRNKIGQALWEPISYPILSIRASEEENKENDEQK